MISSLSKQQKQGAGFTLIELVIGIIIMAISLTLIASLMIPQATHSIEPVQQMRAAELGMSLMNEINGKAYDQNSDHNNEQWRCGETLSGQTIPACTPPANYGPDSGETRDNYNDVDDFHTQDTFIIPTRSDGSSLALLYPNFLVKITVVSDDSLSPLSGDNIAKRIDLEVQLPAGDTILLSNYRWNY